MKKKFLLGLLVIVTIFTTAGCGETQLEQIQNKMNKLDNYKFNLKMEITYKRNNKTHSEPALLEGKVDQKNKTVYLKRTTTTFGIKFTSESYLDLSKDKKIISYYKDNGKWVKGEKESNSQASLIDLYKLMDSNSKIKKVKSDDKKLIHYQVTVDKKAYEEAFTNFSSGNNSFEIPNDVAMDIYVNKDTNYVKRIYVDMKKSLKLKQDGYEIEKFYLEVKYSNYNKIGKVSIPKEALKTATTAKK